ncbi:HRDC domain-containing protein, partial [Bacteroides sp.]|uniref:HRDC domain-containing protein n=1 Tax=Bacteroides sp. TaxID=29523 RepID=UPI00260BB8BB
LSKSREEGIKPYYICNDKQLEDLIQKMPKSKEELLTVSGFGEKKVEKYGDEILEIVRMRD